MAINQHKSLAMGKGATQGGDAPKGGPSPAQRYAKGGRVGDRDDRGGKTEMKKSQTSTKKAPCNY